MPYIEIRMIKGSSLKQKRALVKDVTEVVAKNLKCSPQAIAIELQEFPPGNITQK
jgi:4-oxalocrotonate tautomerase family enzyme